MFEDIIGKNGSEDSVKRKTVICESDGIKWSKCPQCNSISIGLASKGAGIVYFFCADCGAVWSYN